MPIKMEKPTLKKVGEEEAIKQAFIAPLPLILPKTLNFVGGPREKGFSVFASLRSLAKKKKGLFCVHLSQVQIHRSISRTSSSLSCLQRKKVAALATAVKQFAGGFLLNPSILLSLSYSEGGGGGC